MEKLTVSMVAVMHGDSEIINEGETWEAETREELAQKLAAFLRETANQLDPASAAEDAPDVGKIAQTAYAAGQRDLLALQKMGF